MSKLNFIRIPIRHAARCLFVLILGFLTSACPNTLTGNRENAQEQGFESAQDPFHHDELEVEVTLPPPASLKDVESPILIQHPSTMSRTYQNLWDQYGVSAYLRQTPVQVLLGALDTESDAGLRLTPSHLKTKFLVKTARDEACSNMSNGTRRAALFPHPGGPESFENLNHVYLSYFSRYPTVEEIDKINQLVTDSTQPYLAVCLLIFGSMEYWSY